jgi:ABC-type uncharacterized transport system YnjBCD ATPase subunit
LLLDEPFSKLDQALRGDFRAFVFEHARTRGLPVLLVTHDKENAVAEAVLLVSTLTLLIGALASAAALVLTEVAGPNLHSPAAW